MGQNLKKNFVGPILTYMKVLTSKQRDIEFCLDKVCETLPPGGKNEAVTATAQVEAHRKWIREATLRRILSGNHTTPVI